MDGFYYLMSPVVRGWGLVTTAEGATALVLALATLFGIAGAHKLRTPAEAAQSLRNFRLGPAATVAGARALGLAEIAIAVLLLLPQTTRAGQMGAAIASVGFAYLTAVAVRRGERFACNCLSSSELLGPASVARGLAMAVGAVAALSAPQPALSAVTIPLAATGASVVLGLPLAVAALVRSALGHRRFTSHVDWELVSSGWSSPNVSWRAR